MTSQIVLINQSGIGIASDTLVTRYEGSNRHKTFPSQNKIYELGDQHKVVVLHSGFTTLGGLNYGLLIREWALQQINPLPSLSDYPRQFENWISNYRKLKINEDNEIYENLCLAFADFARDLSDEMQDQLNLSEYKNEKISDKVKQKLIESIRGFVEEYFVNDDSYQDITDAAIVKVVREQEHGYIEHFLEHIAFTKKNDLVNWRADAEIIEAIEYFVIQRLKDRKNMPNQATLNFVGFGSDEPIGGRVEVNVSGFYLNRLRSLINRREPEANESVVTIATIAQQDAMVDFMRGLDWSRQKTYKEMAGEIAGKVFADESVTDEKIHEFMDAYDDALYASLWDNYTQPFRRTLGALSVRSLVLFSEALVKIQSLRSATAPGEATVGGLIESLSIDRVQGVEWHVRGKDTNYQTSSSPHPFL
jgi:hypothetical protein